MIKTINNNNNKNDTPFHNLHHLQKFIIYQEKLFKINASFESIEINTLINILQLILKDLSIINSKGYINDSKISLPILDWLIKEYKIKTKITNHSVLMNVLCFNMILLLLYNIVISLEITEDYNVYDNDDLKTDFTTLRKAILRMINPVLKDKILNKGITVLLNTIVGYDSEYELESSLNNLNRLLCIQLAGRTSIILKVPDVTPKPLKPSELNHVKCGSSIQTLMTIFSKSIDNLVIDIRTTLFKDNDLLLNNLSEYMENKGLKFDKIDGFKTFILPKSDVKTLIKYTIACREILKDSVSNYIEGYSSYDLIKDSESLNNDYNELSLLKIIEMLNEILGVKETSKTLRTSVFNSSNKSLSRITYRKDNIRLSITTRRTTYICMHESSADLSILKDFDNFKSNLSIIGRSFVTIGKPLTIENAKSKIHIRDTILIAPAGAKSLAGIGNIYGPEYKKIDLDSYRGRMFDLLKDDPKKFEEYSIQDAIITLKHSNSMEDFYYKVDKIGVPLTLSTIGKCYVVKEWSKKSYKGYQYKDVILGNVSSYMNPKGVRAVDISNYIIPYIAGYRGGRNESFMYGIDIIKDSERSWFDYDLTSCYTSVMTLLGHPDYDKASRLYNNTIQKMTSRDLLLNYIIVEVDFKFKKNVKFPCIPTRVDNDIDIYPLEGRSIITGSEYLVAKSMGCDLSVRSGVLVPFSNVGKKDLKYIGPYKDIVKELQSKRREHPKKTFYNYMYKEIGNSIYGQIAMGISNKKKLDLKTQSMQTISGGILSNPILSSYITGFTRALIGECLHNIDMLKGNVISVTTDGFLTDVSELENKILSLNNNNQHCINLYREIRKYLTSFENHKYDENALEIKHIESKGIISCKTRTQFGCSENGISAASGFQTYNLDRTFLIGEITRIMKSDTNKVLEYIQTGLRGANEIFKHDGHVTSKYSDRKFSLIYDNRRSIIESSEDILNTKPWKNVNEYEKIRFLTNLIEKPVYKKGFLESQSKKYHTYIETGVRGFIKAILSKDNRYGIPKDAFKSYQDIIDFIKGYEPAREVKLSLSSLSKLKNRNAITRTVPRIPVNEAFINYVKQTFINFDDDRFFKELSTERIKERNKEWKKGC